MHGIRSVAGQTLIRKQGGVLREIYYLRRIRFEFIFIVLCLCVFVCVCLFTYKYVYIREGITWAAVCVCVQTKHVQKPIYSLCPDICLSLCNSWAWEGGTGGREKQAAIWRMVSMVRKRHYPSCFAENLRINLCQGTKHMNMPYWRIQYTKQHPIDVCT